MPPFLEYAYEVLSSELFLGFDQSSISFDSAVNTVENTVVVVNYTLNEAVQSVDTELTNAGRERQHCMSVLAGFCQYLLKNEEL